MADIAAGQAVAPDPPASQRRAQRQSRRSATADAEVQFDALLSLQRALLKLAGELQALLGLAHAAQRVVVNVAHKTRCRPLAERPLGIGDPVLLAVALDHLDAMIPSPGFRGIGGPQLAIDVGGRAKLKRQQLLALALAQDVIGSAALATRRFAQLGNLLDARLCAFHGLALIGNALASALEPELSLPSAHRFDPLQALAGVSVARFGEVERFLGAGALFAGPELPVRGL